MENKEILEQICLHCENYHQEIAGCEEWHKLEKDLERLEKQDKILNALLKNANYYYDEWYGMRGNQCIMIGITENDEYFEEIKEMVENGK